MKKTAKATCFARRIACRIVRKKQSFVKDHCWEEDNLQEEYIVETVHYTL